jgi:hypothetical protein
MRDAAMHMAASHILDTRGSQPTCTHQLACGSVVVEWLEQGSHRTPMPCCSSTRRICEFRTWQRVMSGFLEPTLLVLLARGTSSGPER